MDLSEAKSLPMGFDNEEMEILKKWARQEGLRLKIFGPTSGKSVVVSFVEKGAPVHITIGRYSSNQKETHSVYVADQLNKNRPADGKTWRKIRFTKKVSKPFPNDMKLLKPLQNFLKIVERDL